MIASFVGSFVAEGFRCCDNGVIQLSVDPADVPPTGDGMVYEIVGHVIEPNHVQVC